MIPTLSFPAFASHEERLVDQTKLNVVNRLRGKRGFKRFSRDGFLCRIEDKTRRQVIAFLHIDAENFNCNYLSRMFRYYNQGEVKDFESNECEWPIFYTFMIIDGVFRSNTDQIEEYQAELRSCIYADQNGGTYEC